MRAYALSLGLLHVLAFLGVYGAVAGWGLAAGCLILAGAVQSLVVHVIVGIRGYRQAMHRRWPLVLPIDDDAW